MYFLYVAETKALISCVVTAHLIWGFVFAYAKSRFSHDSAQIILHFRYDHLSKCLSKILDERPDNVCDIFEDISNDAKRSKFISTVDTVQDRVEPCTQVALAQVQRKLFAVSTKVT